MSTNSQAPANDPVSAVCVALSALGVTVDPSVLGEMLRDMDLTLVHGQQAAHVAWERRVKAGVLNK